MTKFEKSLLLLSLVFLLGFGIVSFRAARPLPLTVESAERSRVTETETLDLNTATAEELCALPGVGEVLAQRILEYRELAGGFAVAEQLLEVEGIGDAKFAQLREHITVEEHYEDSGR